jgi:adenine-specific DNA-methyltransferase
MRFYCASKSCKLLIIYTKTGGFETNTIGNISDYILWYAKDKSKLKIRKLYKEKKYEDDGKLYSHIELANGERMTIGQWEKETGHPFIYDKRPKGSRLYRASNLSSQGVTSTPQPYKFGNKTYYPSAGNHWKANYPGGMKRLENMNRIVATPNSLQYIRYFEDFPYIAINNLWTDTGTGSFLDEKRYVVQTGTKAIQRCMLMSTDPDDLVLDITCGSGTTAYVAEQWGRRWITCDTSRIAIELAKERLMTATFDYYKLTHPEQGISSGFTYKTIPHIKLEDIANQEESQEEVLYDQPEIDKSKVRVSGPFTVEALPAPINKVPFDAKPLDEDIQPSESQEMTVKQDNWRDEMLSTGILGGSVK